MATVTTYGPGGYDPTRPDRNVVATTTVPDVVGPKSPDDKLAAARTALGTLDTRPGRASVADVVTVLAAVTAALAD